MTTDPAFVFDGNLLCLDFVNTRLRMAGRDVDLLGDFDDLLRWLQMAGCLVPAEARRWRASAGREDAVRLARRLRTALRVVLDRSPAARNGSAMTLCRAVNAILASAPTVTELQRSHGTFRAAHRLVGRDPRQLLVPVARSIVDLLTTGHLERVRRCDDPECVIYFLDTTKNHSRRWCRMDRCGNRHKVAAHAARQRAQSGRRPT